MKRILVTGALGQIGAELVPALRQRHGADAVIASDLRSSDGEDGFLFLDCMDGRALSAAVAEHDIGSIYHLAGVLSRVSEEHPQMALRISVGGLNEVLEVARLHGCSVFFPSSIGVFGPGAPSFAPQEANQRPTTIFGLGKVYGELLCDYYFRRFGVDTRGLRFPGIVSTSVLPGGGVTDYAMELCTAAYLGRNYTCPLAPDTSLEMMYAPDLVKAILTLMEADPLNLIHRNAFNVSAMRFSPRLLAEEVRRHVPDFTIDYSVDPVTQAIATSWSQAIDDSAARKEWGWSPDFDLRSMTGHLFQSFSGEGPARREPAWQQKRPRVFLCYGTEDRERVAALAVRLRAAGFDPWYDKEKLAAGDNWEEEIIAAIESTDFFAICLSRASVAKHGFVNKEVRTAIQEFHRRSFNLGFFLPVRLEECEVPPIRLDSNTTLQSIQWIDFFDGDERGFAELRDAIWKQWGRMRELQHHDG